MGKPKVARSFLEQLADYDSPAPKDFDPEHDVETRGAAIVSSGDEDSFETNDGREHYVDVEESKLRKSNGIELGSQYSGASVSRDVLEENDLDSDQCEPSGTSGQESESSGEQLEEEEDEAIEAFGSDGDNDDDEGDEDEARVIPETFPSTPSATTDDQEDDQGEEDGNGDSDSDTSSSISHRSDRAMLRKMMVEEQKTVAASLSAAAKADITKGKAIKQQLSTFDSLLNTRIKLQKGLVATNSMVGASQSSSSDHHDVAMECASASRAAEEAALNLLKLLKSMRDSLQSSPSSKKRPFPASTGFPSRSLWNQAMYLEDNTRARTRAALTKWSQRTNPSTSLQPQNRFSQAPAQPSLTSVLDLHLSGESMERSIKRTRVARSCAPVQAASKTLVEDEEIYDDADFYTLLLRELVDRRMADTQSASAAPASSLETMLPSRAELKVKKQVDTKASKGRKMRYTVQEKLQNFMVADDKGIWGERQRAELFGSLLGRKVDMEEADGDDGMEDNDVAIDADGLKLFGR